MCGLERPACEGAQKNTQPLALADHTWAHTLACGSRERRGCKSTRLGSTALWHYATPGKAFLSFTLSLAMSSGDIVMPVSASRWATELSSISSKVRGPLLAFALASREAAAFAPVASSIAACFAVACGAQPARQHEQRSLQRSAGAVMCKQVTRRATRPSARTEESAEKRRCGHVQTSYLLRGLHRSSLLLLELVEVVSRIRSAVS